MTALKATVRRRELGEELRDVRERVGISLNDLAHHLGWHPSKLSRIENGKLPCSEVEAAIVLAFCGITGKQLDEIVGLCAGDADGTWLRENGGLPDQLRTLTLHETLATSIQEVELNRIPGLLQTEDYATEVIRGTGLIPECGIAPRVEARRTRQSILWRPSPPNLTCFIHEQAVRLPVGSHKIMHEQVLHLLFLSSQPQCVIRLIPSSIGSHPAISGPFRIMSYQDQGPMVYVETENRSLFLENSVDIATYRLILGKLADVALSAQESRSVLAQYASDYDRAGAHHHDDQDGLA
ncbi:helix-turn-helix transcriptional regulator [Actinokineospora auranticolor]|uniref:Helix-turn-helix protein n=1 Tax=Actinokineospora auranticolor TaxID=155976 RepID=A0A2S6GQI3_9PSEU|nr:helix-turn-helix transcriptional regulator [Actinokineospora auranticolor]PPK67459.1 helix-turn-helix protein [Actinokineospora auranticolor]